MWRGLFSAWLMGLGNALADGAFLLARGSSSFHIARASIFHVRKRGKSRGEKKLPTIIGKKRGKATPRCLSYQYKLASFNARVSLFVLQSETIPESIVKKPVYTRGKERDGKRKLNSRLPSEVVERRRREEETGFPIPPKRGGPPPRRRLDRKGRENTADWILETPERRRVHLSICSLGARVQKIERGGRDCQSSSATDTTLRHAPRSREKSTTQTDTKAEADKRGTERNRSSYILRLHTIMR